ncbi:flagellar FliL protein [Devosia enhydra]|uniref:Flagellar protein FliL n=1 Tax=Devosia enhydra TaxID=665118 RepID=A0A1K2HV20_9HYPH|nr:flagellar basal body-associated FliL family protein [Devosia enhydra]SFZ81517.1 flagellar FliL protein [Devosia enhydra]
MAVDADIEEGAGPAKQAKPARRRLMLMAGAGIGVLLAGGALYAFVLAPKPVEPTTAASAPQNFIFNLPTMTVNLNTDGQGEQFMKLSVALEVANEQVMLDIQPRLPRVIDAFQVYLRELRRSDLEGSAGIYRLREELRRRVNLAIYPAEVQSILFREILVQ